jgi:glycerol-3-phosphate dehydrogenase (NAD(P)+)
MDELKGITIESLVIAERVARAVNIQAQDGKLNLEDFPLMSHIDAVLKGASAADLPWAKFLL